MIRCNWLSIVDHTQHLIDIVAYSCYIVRCSDNTLYTGYCANVEARVKCHNQGKGAKYTRNRLPVILVYCERDCFQTRSLAMRREYAIKQLTKSQKEQLIYENPIS